MHASVDQVIAKYASALVGFALLAALLAPILRDNWPSLPLLFKPPGSWIRLVVPAVLLGLLLWLANATTLLALATREWINLADQSVIASPKYKFSCSNTTVLIMSIPVMALFTPIIEEVINRGLILQSLLPKGRLLAILVSSLLFMMLHKPDTYVFAFLFGIIAAIQMLNWRTLWGPIISHGTFNCLVEIDRFCISGRWITGRLDWGFGEALQSMTLVLVFCIVTATWLVILKRPGSA